MRIKSFYLNAFFLLALMGLSVVSCKNNDDEAKPSSDQFKIDSLKLRTIYLQDSLSRIVNENANIVFTVHVVDGTNMSKTTSVLRTEATAGLTGISVTVAQGGVLTTVVTNSTGQAVFPRMSEGSVAVTIEATAHTNVNFVAKLSKPVAADDNDIFYASTIVPIYSTSGTGLATLNGRAFAELDNTNTSAEKVSSKKVNARLNAASVPSFETENVSILSRGYEEVLYSTTTAADGSFSFTLPSGGSNSMLSYFFDFQEFLGDQITGPSTTQKRRYYFATTPSVQVVSQGIHSRDFFYGNDPANK